MSSRQRNMLEAFKHAGEALPAGSSSSGGPFAGPRRPSEEEIAEAKLPPPDPLEDIDTDVPKATWSQVLEELPGWLPAALGISVALVLGFLIGRATAGDSVQAENSEDTRFVPADGRIGAASGSSATGIGDAGYGAGNGEGRVRILPSEVPDSAAASRPLYDPNNLYTIALITYSNTEIGQARAWATFDALEAEGYPVAEPFRHLSNENSIVLLAGAAPERAGLEDLLARVQRQRIAGDRDYPFGDAYITRISQLIPLWRDL